MPSRSQKLFQEAKKYIPGGVNSPVRACSSVGAEPIFIASGRGARISSVDDRDYVDFVLSWGPLLLGHAHPKVNEAIHAAAERGSSFGAPCPDEVELAKVIVEALPGVEMVRMVNSGTEAAMSALRLARACTGRNKVLKFDGCYHGHADAFLAGAGSGVATLSIPGTPGVPAAAVADTLLRPYNDLQPVKAIFTDHGADLAAVIVEPVAANMGLVLPLPDFLEGLRDLCRANGSLLIFDEVITGFRIGYQGAQGRFNIDPDLTVLGKIIGGGLPVGAYGGKAEYMRQIAPQGQVYQAGTLSGNPLAMAAGLATLKILQGCDYAGLEKRVENFCRELELIFQSLGIDVCINRVASMFTIFFTSQRVTDFASAKTADAALYARFFKHMRDQGLFIAPSAFEAAMISFAHTDDDFISFARAVKSFTG
ncbi:MAG: glutamate-1-semialdehyde 2,1-aminomutase [Desulfovibrio sp.]|jgi:glutamate-1-semialdehyde 2,1-aminomutase|nr:glutamate-1-semialdehyde 2,1-aminomutase [Desulfovibrio sp.]